MHLIKRDSLNFDREQLCSFLPDLGAMACSQDDHEDIVQHVWRSSSPSLGIAMVLASSTAATPKSSRSWARYTTRATAARCFVASSALTSGRSLRSPSSSTVALSGVDILRQFSIPSSGNNERTCLRSGRTPRPFSPNSSILPR